MRHVLHQRGRTMFRPLLLNEIRAYNQMGHSLGQKLTHKDRHIGRALFLIACVLPILQNKQTKIPSDHRGNSI